MGDELKPCPFCGEGGCVVVPRFVDDVVAAKRVECPCCLALGPECPTEERAIKAWNARPRITELVSALETIRAMTNAADPESYRWDAEGCLEAVFSTADTALSNTRGDTK